MNPISQLFWVFLSNSNWKGTNVNERSLNYLLEGWTGIPWRCISLRGLKEGDAIMNLTIGKSHWSVYGLEQVNAGDRICSDTLGMYSHYNNPTTMDIFTFRNEWVHSGSSLRKCYIPRQVYSSTEDKLPKRHQQNSREFGPYLGNSKLLRWL